MLRPGILRVFRLSLFRPDDTRGAVREELTHHLELSIAHLMRQGLSAAEARAEALRRLGPLEDVEQRLYDTARYRERRLQMREWVDVLWRDLRYAARGLRREPVLTLVIVVTLALGMGANASVFPMVDRLLFRMPPGVRSAEEVHRVYAGERRDQGRIEIREIYSYPEVEDIRAALRGVAEVGSYYTAVISVAGDTAPERRVGVAYVSSELLPVLGTRMARGRVFSRAETDPASPQLIAIISDDVWRTRFTADPGIIGRKVRLGSREFIVIGVTAPSFAGIDLMPTDVWLPLSTQRMFFNSKGPWWTTRSVQGWRVVTRVPEPGREAAVAAATRGFHDGILAAGQPDREPRLQFGSIIRARGPQKAAPGQNIATRLAGVSIVLLLIAIANVTNLLLARGARRQREIAVRTALGITRVRLVTSFLVEAGLYALLAALAAAACSVLIGGVVRSLVLPNSAWTPPALDARAIAFTAVLAAVCAGVAGLIPALQATRAQPYPFLKTHYFGERSGWLRTSLLTAQAALSALLLVGAGLFITSLDRVQKVDTGYDLDRVAAINALGDGEQQRSALELVAQRIAQHPDVEAVALSSVTPLRGLGGYDTYLPGRDSALSEGYTPDINGVTPDFFRATGLRVTRGRGFAQTDRLGSAPVMVVNQEAARVLWPNSDALGVCVRLESRTGPCYTVVGIAQNTPRFRVLEDAPLQAYVPLEQLPDHAPPRAILIRSRSDPSAVSKLAEQELNTQLHSTNAAAVFLYRDWLEPQLAPWKLGARLFSVIASLSLMLAIVGLYSVLAYSVTQRAHELGVRIALGASVSRVMGVVMAQGTRPLLFGLMLGLALAAAAGKLIAALLYDTSTVEPIVYVTVALTLTIAGLVASIIPAVRAAQIDPARMLRSE